jgi:hypothetical protein
MEEEVYLIRIADYLDGKMSPEEEEGFMRDVERDAVLRSLFEQELETAALFTPVTPSAAPVRRYFPYRLAAVAAALVAVAVGIYVVRVDRTPARIAVIHRDTVVAATPPRPDTQRVTGPVLAARYLQPYDGSKDPVEVSYYYNQYRRGRYAEVMDAKPVDYQVLDAGGSKNALLRRYMALYKGLCLLEQQQPNRARRYLDSASMGTSPGDTLTFTAQWYSLLAALRQGDQTGIQDLAGRLARRQNPYQERARKILQELL